MSKAAKPGQDDIQVVELSAEIKASPLYGEDLAPVPKDKRTWSMWNLSFIWVGMAVCIPTYMLASLMIKSGMSWYAALLIIGLANLVITIPMALNGHGGVKYGLPFPVLGRAAFGTNGVHIPAVVRAIIACGWFGIQTWIGGLAIYAIFNAATGSEGSATLDIGKFIAFAVFWLINMYFVWKGTESIKWLEEYSAPILIVMGLGLIVWGASQAGGFGVVLDQSQQLERPTASLYADNGGYLLNLHPIRNKDGAIKATEYRVTFPGQNEGFWNTIQGDMPDIRFDPAEISPGLRDGSESIGIQFRRVEAGGINFESSTVQVSLSEPGTKGVGGMLWTYVLYFTAMVGFWATMAISIADITRYTHTQKSQVMGQFIGLPGTMILYSFVGIFVTCAAVINFQDILISDDAPWDPVSLLSKFDNPVVVIIAQIFMLIATLSTNIAANVIAPANAFSNLSPRKISFRMGGTITGVIGILICPWLLLDQISGILIFVSGLLGPVLGILLSDYFLVRKKHLNLPELFKVKGIYAFGGSGFNPAAMVALLAGVLFALIGMWVPVLAFLYSLSWFSGFIVALVVYYLMMRGKVETSIK